MADNDPNNSVPATSPSFWIQLGNWLRSIPKSAVLSLIGPIAVLVFGYFGWRFYGARVLDTSYYGIKPESIEITSPPPWLKSSIKEEVYQGSNIGRMSLLDDQTTAVIARAFDKHPWVRKTHHVVKIPGGVVVSVEYREPVAMVVCEATTNPGTGESNGERLLPVDKEGVVLPTKDFNENDIPKFLLIFAQGIKASEPKKAGLPFGDTRIDEAVQLCRIINPLRATARLTSVYVYPSTEVGKTRWKLELLTSDGSRIMWGSAPGMEGLGEPSPQSKLNRLGDLISSRALVAGTEFDLSKSAIGQPNNQ